MQAKKELVLFLILIRAPRDNCRIVGNSEVMAETFRPLWQICRDFAGAALAAKLLYRVWK
jgi:hypothetical protein